METPEIPGRDDPDFVDALSALVNSTTVMRRLLLMIVGAGSDPERLMREHGKVILQSDAGCH